MKTEKEILVEILKLKLAIESLELSESQLKEGTDDLHFRLSHFQKRVLDKERYQEQFFNPTSKKEIVLKKDMQNKKQILLKSESWIKTLFRKIVLISHPDKFQNFTVPDIKEKYLKVYRKTIEAWQKKSNDKIILCANEVGINIKNPEALPILKTGIENTSKRLNEIKKLIAYQWYHVPDADKPAVLEDYLRKNGYSIEPEKIKKVVFAPRKRKVGTRPQRLKTIRKLKM